MRRSPHRFLPLLLVVPLILSLAPGVLANAPVSPPRGEFSCDVSPVAEEDFFVDLLIPLAPGDEGYTACNRKHLALLGFDESAPLLSYAEGGYRSFTLHYSAAELIFRRPLYPDDSSLTSTFILADSHSTLDQLAGTGKLAIVDRTGAIRLVTEPFDLTLPEGMAYLYEISYSLDSAKFYPSYDRKSIFTPLSLLFLPVLVFERAKGQLLLILLTMAFSISFELLLAKCFQIRPLWLVLVCNALTQCGLFLFLYSVPLPYPTAVFFGELAVYLVEATALLLFSSAPKRRAFCYVLVANTVTLLFGLLFQLF